MTQILLYKWDGFFCVNCVIGLIAFNMQYGLRSKIVSHYCFIYCSITLFSCSSETNWHVLMSCIDSSHRAMDQVEFIHLTSVIERIARISLVVFGLNAVVCRRPLKISRMRFGFAIHDTDL